LGERRSAAEMAISNAFAATAARRFSIIPFVPLTHLFVEPTSSMRQPLKMLLTMIVSSAPLPRATQVSLHFQPPVQDAAWRARHRILVTVMALVTWGTPNPTETDYRTASPGCAGLLCRSSIASVDIGDAAGDDQIFVWPAERRGKGFITQRLRIPQANSQLFGALRQLCQLRRVSASVKPKRPFDY